MVVVLAANKSDLGDPRAFMKVYPHVASSSLSNLCCQLYIYELCFRVC